MADGHNLPYGTTQVPLPLCKCGFSSVEREVKKVGPNTGRHFYSCATNSDNGGCKFFQFVDEVADGSRKRKFDQVQVPPSSRPAPPAESLTAEEWAQIPERLNALFHTFESNHRQLMETLNGLFVAVNQTRPPPLETRK